MEHVGQTVTLAGFMENVREVGQNFAFVVLRDFYGTTQVVVETEDMMAVIKGLNKESTLQVTGIVRERSSKNPNLPTGDIEVVPTDIKVLGRCIYNELPFPINRSRDADESIRLKYRYLDLRNPAVKQNIILRCQVVSALRAAAQAKFRKIHPRRRTVTIPHPVHTKGSFQREGVSGMTMGSFLRGMAVGAAVGIAADMLLRPNARPKTEAGKALQSVTDAVDNAASDVMRKMR